jgi:hypothetical protein
MAHITILELKTVRLALREGSRALRLARERGDKLGGGALQEKNMGMYVVNQWLSKSPAVMAELRKLHRLCGHHGLTLDLHHLPSALNLCAESLSRRRRFVEYLPFLGGIPGP